jgi:hypothetical protein
MIRVGRLVVLSGVIGLIAACARVEAIGTADDLREIARARGIELRPTGCRTVDSSRVVVCTARIDDAAFAGMRDRLALTPLATAHAPGPPFGKSRCLEGAVAERAWVTALPWLANSHYRYLLIVLDGVGGACIETEHGYG